MEVFPFQYRDLQEEAYWGTFHQNNVQLTTAEHAETPYLIFSFSPIAE